MLNFKLSDAKRPLVSEIRRKTAREVVLDGIQHQIGLLTNKAYTVERTRYSKDADGSSIRKVVAAPPRPWFWKTPDGTVMVQVKYGHAVTIEIEPGKPTIIAGKSEKDAVLVLTQVVDAVKTGKLDPQIEAAKAKAKKNRKGD